MNKYHILFLSLLIFSSCQLKKDNAEGDAEDIMLSPWIELDDSKNILTTWSKENTIIYHVISEPSDMHPTNGNTSPRSEINLYTQMFLVNTDFKNQGISPGLIKSLPSISTDGLEYTYELRNEPRWDDGSRLTLDDVIFTCKAIKCPLTNNPHAKPYWENLKDVRIDPDNPRKFTLVMKKQYFQNVAFLTDYPVMQRTYFDPKDVLSHFTLEQFDRKDFKTESYKNLLDWSHDFNNEKFGHDPDKLKGSGMYKFENWEQGQSITLIKKKNHWTEHSNDYHEAAFPDKIIFKLNKDENSSMLEFKSQVMDASTNLSAKTLMTLKENELFNENYHSLFIPSYNYTYIAMNKKPDGVLHKKFFTDQRVRRAMAYLSPVQDIIKFVYKNYSTRSTQLASNVSPLKPECDRELQPIPVDIEKAKELLDAAGWKDTDADGIRDKIIDGEKISFQFDFQFLNTSGDWKDMATMIADQMSKAGVKANLRSLDLKIFLEKARHHDFDMMMGVWGGSSQSEDFTQLWHSNSWINQGSNYSGFGNSASDQLIDSIRYTIDHTKRTQMSKRLQRLIYDDQPYVFLYASLRRNVIHKRFGNAVMYADRPGILLNTLKMLSGNSGLAMKDGVSPF